MPRLPCLAWLSPALTLAGLVAGLHPALARPATSAPSTLHAERLGSHAGLEWVGVAGKAYPLEASQVATPRLALPQLITSCLQAPKPAHGPCFEQAASRVARLLVELSSSLEHPNNPLYIPPAARGPANLARDRVMARLKAVAERFSTVAQKPEPPRAPERKEMIEEIRSIASTLVAFSNLQRGRVGIAVRGGASMGAYQAGVLYYLGEFLKLHATRWSRESPSLDESRLLPHFEVATGSSAGALNALLASHQGCQRPQSDPTRSALYDSWMRVGMTGRDGGAGLRRSPRLARNSSHLLDPTPIEDAARRLEKRLRAAERYRAGCAIDLGVTVTRLDDNRYPVMGRSQGRSPIQVRRARERFAFSLRVLPPAAGARLRRPQLRIHNRLPSPALHRQGLAGIASRDSLHPFYLAYGSPQNYKKPVGLQALLQTTMASGSVPIAFAPRILPFTAFDTHGKASPRHSGRAPFADGGIFDNRPLSFAIELSRWRRADRLKARLSRDHAGLRSAPFLPERGAWARELHMGLTQATSQREWQLWLARADLRRQLDQAPSELQAISSQALPSEPWQELLDLIPASPRTIVFVEPTLTSWAGSNELSALRVKNAKRKRPKLVNTVAGHLGNFVASARDASLLTSIEAQPWMQDSERGDLRPRVVIPRRSIPIAGERLKRFLAFFEQDFRIFDFFVGVSDAWRFAQHDDPVFRLSGSLPKIHDPRFTCLVDYQTKDAKGLPKTLTRTLLRELLARCSQASLLSSKDRAQIAQLKGSIAKLEREGIDRIEAYKAPSPHHRQLELAQRNIAANNFAAMLVAMHNFRALAGQSPNNQNPQENFDQFFEELGRAGFRHVDMVALAKSLRVGLAHYRYRRRGIRGIDARKIVRHTLEDAIGKLAKAQVRYMDFVGVSVLGKTLADIYRPFDPRLSLDLGLTFNGLEARLTGHPFFNRFRMDWGLLRLYRLGAYTIRSRTFPRLPGYDQILFDLDFGIRAGARLFHLSRFMRVSAMAGPTVSFTHSLGDGSSSLSIDAGGEAYMRRFGAQLGVELLLLRRFYIEFTGTHWFAEHSQAHWPQKGPQAPNWYSVGHGNSVGPCRWGAKNMSFWGCVQSSLSAGWRWDL